MIHELSIRPLNLNQLAERLGVDYRTVMHHAEVLKSNSLVAVSYTHLTLPTICSV